MSISFFGNSFIQLIHSITEALLGQREATPEGHAEIAEVTNDMTLMYQSIGRHEEAIKYNKLTLEERRKAFPENHSLIATTLNNMGSIYRSHEKLEEVTEQNHLVETVWLLMCICVYLANY